MRTPRARRIRILMFGKIKCGNTFRALAPAAYIERLIIAKHITGLLPVRGLARHCVHAIDRHHRQNLLPPAIRHADLVFVAGFADHVIATVMLMDRQRAIFHAIVHRDVGDVAHRARRAGESGQY